MKVVVMGAGVIGVTTAWYLAKAGAEVDVIERQAGPAEETSFANAGELSFGLASPWAAPGLPAKALKMLVSPHAPLRISAIADPLLWRWGRQFLRECTGENTTRNLGRMQRIARYSAQSMPDLMAETGIDFDEGDKGTIVLCRSAPQMAGMQAFRDMLTREGVQSEALDRDGCIAIEPGLADADIVGGMRLPGDRTGDCRKFTIALAGKAAEMGVRFLYGKTLRRIAVRKGAVCWLETETGETFSADRYVCALGCHSARMLQNVGLRVPVYPVKGYSITLPVLDASKAPVSTLIDETHKVAITRLGDRIRVGGIAELGGLNTRLSPKPLETLRFALNSLFPGSGALDACTPWTGLRPMTPDGTPILGETPLANLFMNTGHGTFGWTLSSGSARAVADRVMGRVTDIALDGLSLSRFG